MAPRDWDDNLWDSGLSNNDVLAGFERRLRENREKFKKRKQDLLDKKASFSVCDVWDTREESRETELQKIRNGFYLDQQKQRKAQLFLESPLKGLWKMAKKSGGIGIGALVFWGWIFYSFVLDDDDKKEVKDTAKTKSKSVVEEMMPVVKKAKKEVQNAIDTAKIKLKQEKDNLEGKSDGVLDTIDKDPFGDYEEDKYGSSEDKY
jgi:hypothetical protein